MKTEHISISSNDRIILISNFATLLTAGISILEAVDSLLEDAKGSQAILLITLREDLTQGKHVYQSFAKFPLVFDKVVINVIKASEEAGNLDVTLWELKENMRKESEFIDKIKSALAYPAVIMVVFLGVLLMMLVFVIPKIVTVFSRLKVTLPLPTRILIFASNILLQFTVPVLIGTGVIVLIIIIIYKTNKKLLLNLLFSLPIVSGLIKQVDLIRFSRSLYYLLSSGIPIVTALELTQEVVIKKNISNLILHSKEMVIAGKKLSEGLRNSKTKIPSIMIKIIEAGEKSGSLDKSLKDVSEYFDYQITNTLRNLTVLLEPIMLVVVAILVGGMMLAIIGPIYNMIGQVGAR
ncbi:type II secretion system F family protein [Candidatus Roizmanbacteria bacterium]|nr:type II secretion system F family protein [Candidatus Roizmanbacteria bacterium]